ncbi:MAG: hypothetical protein AAGG68_04325 [Bacteroidota bacterium]
MDALQNKRNNVLLILAIAVLCFFLYHQSGILEDAGMAAIILNWFPLIIGLGTLLFYFIGTALFKKYAWIITALGCLLNIMIVITAFVKA